MIEVRNVAHYSLVYEKQYYILENEGLTMNIMKKQDSCPNSHTTVEALDESDWSRLICTLYTIDRVKMRELERCVIEESVL